MPLEKSGDIGIYEGSLVIRFKEISDPEDRVLYLCDDDDEVDTRRSDSDQGIINNTTTLMSLRDLEALLREATHN